MPRFVFQLDGVLSHRKTLEKQRQRDVAVVAAKMLTLETQLRALDEEVRGASGDVRQNHLVGPLDMQYLAAHRRYLAGTQRKALALANEIAAVHRELDALRTALAEAAKQRKILETLREKHHAAWLADANRREFNQQDDLYTQLSHWREGKAGAEDNEGREGADDPDSPPVIEADTANSAAGYVG